MIREWLERKAFEKSLTSTRFFREVVRPILYTRARNDAEQVHEFALEALVLYESAVRKVSPLFDIPELQLELAGKCVTPFGIAAGLDKNGDASYPLSKLFGFLEIGTIVVPKREGNLRPRVAVDNEREEIYNAQGFPSKGLDHVLGNLAAYRSRDGQAPLLLNICGIPPDQNQLAVAHQELETLLDKLGPYADGFVWNPFSPNTEALKLLRTPDEFKQTAEQVKEKAPTKLRLVKMGPYDSVLERQRAWLELVGAWMDGGGHGVVVVNTYMVPKETVPAENWKYPSAGRSGKFLQVYRQRAIKDVRREFPKAFIIATGGIDSAEEAMAAFKAGANVLEGYTPYTFHGFGLLHEIALGVITKLNVNGYKTLADFQKNLRAATCRKY